jgi:hypothetical protein
MTESNPFAVTIELLKGCLEDCGINGFGGDQIESMKVSLRVLEAAGKVDKEWAIRVYDAANEFVRAKGHVPPDDQCGSIRALLAALSDKSAEPGIPEGEEPR